MRTRFKIPLSLTGFLIFILFVLLTTFLIMNKYISSTSLFTDSSLSINYISKNIINETNYKNVQFSATNDSSQAIYYYISFSNVESKEEIPFDLKRNGKSFVKGDFKSEVISSFIKLDPNETDNYSLTLYPNNKTKFNGKLIIKKEVIQNNLFSDLILSDNIPKTKTQSGISKNSAIFNEGLIKSTDSDGTAYYFRGDIKNNYVLLDDITFRIVKINGDKTVKLITDNLLDYQSFYSNNEERFEDSEIINTLKLWYETHLDKYEDIIANKKYCNDNSKVDNNYTAYNRVMKDYNPTFKCPGEEISLKVGLLSVDEYIYAGACHKENNTTFYLHNKDITIDYYLMSGARSVNDLYYPFIAASNGTVLTNVVATTNLGVRPVVNVIKNIEATGQGTKDNPYILKVN